jgi:hypothetical protein
LREAGYAPAAEGADGSVVSLADDAPRAPSRPVTRLMRARPEADLDAHAGELVRRMRAAESAPAAVRPVPSDRVSSSWAPGLGIPGVTSAAMLGTIREAVRSGQRIDVGYADADGGASRHTILPISMAGGSVRGHESASRQLLALALHRITDIVVLPDDLDDRDLLDDDLDGPGLADRTGFESALGSAGATTVGPTVGPDRDNRRLPDPSPADVRQETRPV